jgi:acyl carrier protein
MPIAMTDAEIHTTLAAIAASELDWTEPLPSGSLADALDSLQRMTLVVAVEDRFAICLDLDDEANIDTMADLVAAIRAKLATPLAGPADAQRIAPPFPSTPAQPSQPSQPSPPSQAS